QIALVSECLESPTPIADHDAQVAHLKVPCLTAARRCQGIEVKADILVAEETSCLVLEHSFARQLVVAHEARADHDHQGLPLLGRCFARHAIVRLPGHIPAWSRSEAGNSQEQPRLIHERLPPYDWCDPGPASEDGHGEGDVVPSGNTSGP